MTAERNRQSGLGSRAVASPIAVQNEFSSLQQGVTVGPLAKRWLDLTIAVPALIVALPIMLLAMLVVYLIDPGSVLFRQPRIGRNGLPFMMLKIRTMYEGSSDSRFRDYNIRELLGNAEPSNKGLFRLEDDDRIIKCGRLIRRYAIDELPQLINVIRGEMSLVGPRPLQPWEVELFTNEEHRRHSLLPGMTGLWQVSGRNRLSMRQMLDLDLAYVDHHSLSLDIKIILSTLPAVFRDDTC
jgi:lipopolysaccharide/colanic/teichoic acid biosynthesis glycosyltransferase